MSGELYPTAEEWYYWYADKREKAIVSYMNRPKGRPLHSLRLHTGSVTDAIHNFYSWGAYPKETYGYYLRYKYNKFLLSMGEQ